VPEVAHGRAGGPFVAFHDGDRQAAAHRVDGVRQPDDAGPDDDEIGRAKTCHDKYDDVKR
jgi:hypothetical protein